MSLGVGFKESSSESSSKGESGFRPSLRKAAGEQGLSFIQNVLFPNLAKNASPERDSTGRPLPAHNSRGLRNQHEAALSSIAAMMTSKGHGPAVTASGRKALADSSFRNALPSILKSLTDDQRRSELKPLRDLQSQQGLLQVLQAFGSGSTSSSKSSSRTTRGSFGF